MKEREKKTVFYKSVKNNQTKLIKTITLNSKFKWQHTKIIFNKFNNKTTKKILKRKIFG